MRTELRTGDGNKIREAARMERPDRNASEGIEPRNYQRQRGRQSSFTGRQQEQGRNSESLFSLSGSKSAVRNHWRHVRNLGDPDVFPEEGIPANNPKRRGCGDEQQEVGLIRIRGVSRVTPTASKTAHSKGSALTV